MLVREHLNNWYSLKAYYIAKTLVEIPFQIMFSTFYLAIVYLMTNQPLDPQRFAMWLVILICMAFMGQSIGLFFGAVFGIRAAVFVAPTSVLPLVLFCGFFINFSAIPTHIYWFSYLSFMAYAFEGSIITLYGYERPPLYCPQPYCLFRHPESFLEKFDMNNRSYVWSVVGLVITIVITRIAAYYALRFKLKHTR